MTFSDHFSTIAARYAAYRPHYPRALVDALADRSIPGAGVNPAPSTSGPGAGVNPAPSTSGPGVAWDIGCGSGQLSVALAARFSRVIATDPAQAQLDAAVAHPCVEYRCVPAEASGLPDASIDLAVAAQAAHWFDWPRFVVEVGRVARPGALIALVSYGNLDLDGAVGAELVRYRDVVAPYWPPERVHVDNGYRDLVLPWPAVEAPAIDMTATWTRDELLGYIQTWSATVKLVEREGRRPVIEMCERVAGAWHDGETRTIRWPLAIRLARR